MGQHFQLHLCLEFCQESLKCANTYLLPDLQVFVAMYSLVHRPPWTMLGQFCHQHSKGTSEAWLPSSHLGAEIHFQVAVVVFLTQKSERQVCNGMAGWAKVSCSWEKIAALNNLWPCWSFALLPALPMYSHTATLHTQRLTGPFSDWGQQTLVSSGISSQCQGHWGWWVDGPNTTRGSLPGLQHSRTSHRSLEASRQ